MEEIRICPKCQAMCDPDTNECLVCGEVHYDLTKGDALDIRGPAAWYTLPIKWRGSIGTLTFHCQPIFEITNKDIDFNRQRIPVKEACITFNMNERIVDGHSVLFVANFDEGE